MWRRGKPRIQEETKKWFFTFSQELKIIFSVFAIANPLDSRVAEAKGILQDPWFIFWRGFFYKEGGSEWRRRR